MKNILMAIAFWSVFTPPLLAAEITVISFGGAYTKSQVEAYHKPFTAKTGIKINSVDSIDPAITLKAQVEARNVSADVVDVQFADAIGFCDEGLLERIDPRQLPPAPDGTPASEDFFKGALHECGVSSIFFSTLFAYNTEKTKRAPKTIDDFFDVTNFPGKRGVRREANGNLEMALMADGVAPNQVYKVLGTKEGVARAFAKLDSIKDHIIWWESGAQAPQLLADGEVAMSTAYNGRVFDAAVGEGQPLKIVWDGQILGLDMFVIPKGAPDKEAALKFIAFATSPKQLAAQASWISYGPARKSSTSLVGVYKDGKTQMAPHMPNAPANLKRALITDYEFWADKDAELNERFNAWLAQ